MTRRRITSFLCAAIALLAMAMSAVAACACGHHQGAQKQKPEPISCHGASHETPKTETSDNGQTRFDENCICSFGTLNAAIVAKSETKRSKAERLIAAENGNIVEIETTSGEIASSEPPAFSTLYFFSAYFRRSGPSRAPPRL